METQTTTANLQNVKEYLLRIHPGQFEEDNYLEAWMNPAVCEYFIEHAVEVVPKTILWGQGKPFQCHLNTLTYAAEHDGATPWFGMQYLQWADAMGGKSASSWELHSWIVEADGTTIVDSGEYVPEVTRYIGLKWSWELFDLMKRTNTSMEQVQTSTTELWCSGCKTTHPTSAFGVNRSKRRGYQSLCREAHAKCQATYRRTENGRDVSTKYDVAHHEGIREYQAKYHADNHQAIRERKVKRHAELRRRTFEIIGDVCAGSLLGGCAGELEADHIIPVKRRHKTGFTSAGIPLYRWICENPAEAKKKCQALCNSHNCFKNDRSEVDAQVAWVKKNPVLFLMTVASHLEEAGVLDLQRAA